MTSEFSSVFSQLRRKKKLSQRKVAADLKISQALLSHYENGIREPRLDFVVRACEYYGVSADYMLGRTSVQNETVINNAYIGKKSGTKKLEQSELIKLINMVTTELKLVEYFGEEEAMRQMHKYLAFSLYKVFCLLNISVPGVLVQDLKVPKEEAVAMCDVMIKMAESKILHILNSKETEEQNQRLTDAEFKKAIAILEEAIKKADAQLDSLLNQE